MHKAEVDRLFAEWDRSDSPGAALAVVREGTVEYMKGYGIANLEYGVPITPSTVFDIASVSKQFAAMCIAMLLDEGKVSLDDDIHKYIPEVPDFGKEITVRHLVHHTSGIRDWVQFLAISGWRMDDVISFEHIMKMVRRQKELNYDPGAEYLYSNTNYNLLAEIVARVSGKTFCEYTDDRIFEPLGMKNTHFHGDHEVLVKNRACSYSSDGDGFRNCINNLMALGSSSLYSTVEDLAKWLINFHEPRVGGASVIEQMHQRGTLNNGDAISYAFGLLVGEYRGLKDVWHNGSWAGFRSHLAHFPEQKFGVVVLSNLGSINTGDLARKVADIYLADYLEPEDAHQKTENRKDQSDSEIILKPEKLREYVGAYYSEEADTTYRIILRGDQLMAKHRRHSDISLKYKGDCFVGSEWFLSEIRFVRGGKGEVNGFRLTGGRVRNLRFDKLTD